MIQVSLKPGQKRTFMISFFSKNVKNKIGFYKS